MSELLLLTEVVGLPLLLPLPPPFLPASHSPPREPTVACCSRARGLGVTVESGTFFHHRSASGRCRGEDRLREPRHVQLAGGRASKLTSHFIPGNSARKWSCCPAKPPPRMHTAASKRATLINHFLTVFAGLAERRTSPGSLTAAKSPLHYCTLGFLLQTEARWTLIRLVSSELGSTFCYEFKKICIKVGAQYVGE